MPWSPRPHRLSLGNPVDRPIFRPLTSRAALDPLKADFLHHPIAAIAQPGIALNRPARRCPLVGRSVETRLRAGGPCLNYCAKRPSGVSPQGWGIRTARGDASRVWPSLSRTRTRKSRRRWPALLVGQIVCDAAQSHRPLALSSDLADPAPASGDHPSQPCPPAGRYAVTTRRARAVKGRHPRPASPQAGGSLLFFSARDPREL